MKLFATVLLIPAAFMWQTSGVMAPSADDSDIIFSHRFHLEDQELACDDCHEGVAASEAGLDDLLPSMETCATCHDVEDTDNCVQCHENGDDPGGYPRITDYAQKFSHALHIPAGLECATCHEEVASMEDVEGSALPGMAACVDCHDDRAVESRCLTCHLPEDDLVPASHLIGFSRAHSDLARRDALTSTGDIRCATCHQEVFCQDCHEGENLDRTSHPLNYEFTHALDAQSAAVNCSSCHSDTAFCADCHAESQLMPYTHTAGWTNRLDGGRHRFEAVADLASCIACHEDNAELFCRPCHESN